MKQDIFYAPQRLGNFVTQEQVGKGVTCVVYKAFDALTLESVAIKHVRVDAAKTSGKTDDNKKRVVTNECEMLKSLSHSNIVRLLDSFEADSHLNLVLEFMECGSLENLLKKVGCLSEATTRRIVIQVLEALEYLGTKKVAHRDLKGANLLLDKAGNVKLTDFGLAKHVNQGMKNQENKNKCFVGTPYWMSPEMIQNSDGVTEATDIWSLGCTVIELLTGKPPLSELMHYQVFFMVTEKDQLVDTSAFSKECADFLSLCLSKDPKKRPVPSSLMRHGWLAPEYQELVESKRKLRQANSASNLMVPIQIERFVREKPEWTGLVKTRTEEREKSEVNTRLRQVSRNSRMAISKKHSIILKGTQSEEFQTVKAGHDKLCSQGSKQSFKNLLLPTEKDVLDEYTEEAQRPKKSNQRLFGEKKPMRESVVKSKAKVLPEAPRKQKINSGQFQMEGKMQTRPENGTSRQGSVPCHKPKQQSCIQATVAWDEPKLAISHEERERIRLFLEEAVHKDEVGWSEGSSTALETLSNGLSMDVYQTLDFGILLKWANYGGEERERALECVYKWLARSLGDKNGLILLEMVGYDAIIDFLRKSLPDLHTESVLIGQNLVVCRQLVVALTGPLPTSLLVKYLKKAVELFRERVFSERFAGFYLDRIGQVVEVVFQIIENEEKQNKSDIFLRHLVTSTLLDDLLMVLLLFVEHKNKRRVDEEILVLLRALVEAGLASKIRQSFYYSLQRSSFLKVLTLFMNKVPDFSDASEMAREVVAAVVRESKGLPKWAELEGLRTGLDLRERVHSDSTLKNMLDRVSRQRGQKSGSRKVKREKEFEWT
jgi:serine/threonine protein kinase